MSFEPGDARLSAAELVMMVEPLDDDGADAADRFDWQAATAAADCLALYLAALDHDGRLAENEDRRIVCERHEDWVPIHGDDAEIVSGKHREPAYGSYTTLNKLFDDGGIAHLFLRWLALDEKPTCLSGSKTPACALTLPSTNTIAGVL
ncbi:hypothetical protein ABH935_006457 [Catenulispora sp. GAS73]|uniref:hypothetical protein n=1 Tax=Catenulispora sp. GAS73 TaxID=3156269 RepID=UPI00351406AF